MSITFQRLLTCAFLLICTMAFAQKSSEKATLKIDDNLEERIFSIEKLPYFEDTTGSLTLAEVKAPKFQGNFKIRPGVSKSDFETSSTYWVKLSIEKTPNSSKKWVMEFYDQTIDLIEVFAPDEKGNYQIVRMGDGLPFHDRNFIHKNFELILDNGSIGIDHYYIKIQSSQKADIRIAIRSLNRFLYYALNEYFIYGLFYGMIMIIALYNILVYFAVREVKYLYYTFYLLSVGIYAMCVDGIAFQYLWPNSPSWNQIANGIFSYSIVLWATLFSIRFLSTNTRAKFLHKALLVVLGMKTVLFLMGIFVNPTWFEIRYYDVIPFFLIFYSSIYIWSKGYKVVRFFVIAYGVLFIGMAIKVLSNAAVIQHYTLIYYSLHLAFLVEMLLLTFALGDRIRILKKNKDLALRRSLDQMKSNYALKEKVNRELEEKVQERTKELESKNLLLESFNSQLIEKDEEIKRINALLDRDNWKLKSSIKQSFQARLDNDTLTHEEFSNIFPDSSACFRYLEELKWAKAFHCRSCGNHKCSNGPKLFTRRCSKCGYIESVTAGTAFHGVRFPLEKAFFIAYTIISGQHWTLEQLSEQLDVRKNTIWSFRKKVKSMLVDSKSEKADWKDIIIDQDVVKTGHPLIPKN
ncbi:7TM diverse intracellular signaling domain-containing protein [Litoribacter populi]|uniref:7TM diverse intracellular signaling domain-containing protein n=1 Tax=Litoribacter populi TaxID=2598460 RepID=UPI0011802FC3|nr:7TM diverse intracellular signaling domain-containing protein [Litoribacter populi]